MPVSGLKATKPPSPAGIKTALRVMHVVCWNEALSQGARYAAEFLILVKSARAALPRKGTHGLESAMRESRPSSAMGGAGFKSLSLDPVSYGQRSSGRIAPGVLTSHKRLVAVLAEVYFFQDDHR